MAEQEYVIIQSHITKNSFGTERTDKLIAKASNISEDFKDDLWNDYNIDLDNMEVK